MLPDGWSEATLGDVTSVRASKADPLVLGSTPFIGLEHIEPHTSRLIGRGTAADVRSAVAQFKSGDVLYGRLRPYLNKVLHASFDGCASAEIVPLTPEEGVEGSLLRRVIMSAQFLDFTASMDKGDRPRVNADEVISFRFWLPPSAEQGRIVAKLDALSVRLSRARAELDRVPVLADNLRSTALAHEYHEHLEKSGAHPVQYFISTLDQGWSPKCESYSAPDEETWGVLKTTAIQALEFRPFENKALPAALAPRPKIEVEKGDILVTRAGPRVRCGITCVVRKTRRRLMLADKMYRLRCKPSRALPTYLALMLNAPESLERIETMKTGMSDSGLNLTQDKFLSLPVPNADLGKQRETVERLELAFARADRLEAEAARARALLDRLEAAILARAFRGELVPQDPNDEPASVLLDRIRAQRAAAPQAKRGRRAREPADA